MVGIWSALILRVSGRLRVQANSYSVHVPEQETKLSIGARGHAVRASTTETVFLKQKFCRYAAKYCNPRFITTSKRAPNRETLANLQAPRTSQASRHPHKTEPVYRTEASCKGDKNPTGRVRSTARLQGSLAFGESGDDLEGFCRLL